jgi:hypothetical protein
MTFEYGGPLTLFEVAGRQIAEQWIDELSEWEEDLPPGGMPSDINLTRLIEWSANIVGLVAAYETTVHLADQWGYPPRTEREAMLEAMRGARRQVCRKVTEVWETAKEHEEAQRTVQANNLESRLELALSGGGGA